MQFTAYAQSSPTSIENICGGVDNRVDSDNKAVGRIWLDGDAVPSGTAFIISNGKLITAGHVLDGSRKGVIVAVGFRFSGILTGALVLVGRK